MNIRTINLHSTDSTNNYLRGYVMDDNDDIVVVKADYQTAGRGQGSNTWESEDGKNLLFSLMVRPHTVPVASQFVLSMTMAVALKEALDGYAEGFELKWPNDIYYGDRKLAGMLIEHSLTSTKISQTIIGIGLNVNQQKFISDAPNPVSLSQITGREHDLTELLHAICNRIEEYTAFDGYDAEAFAALHSRYMEHLYRHDGAMHPFALPGGEQIEASIADVHRDGILTLRHADGTMHDYAFKEVAFVI